MPLLPIKLVIGGQGLLKRTDLKRRLLHPLPQLRQFLGLLFHCGEVTGRLGKLLLIGRVVLPEVLLPLPLLFMHLEDLEIGGGLGQLRSGPVRVGLGLLPHALKHIYDVLRQDIGLLRLHEAGVPRGAVGKAQRLDDGLLSLSYGTVGITRLVGLGLEDVLQLTIALSREDLLEKLPLLIACGVEEAAEAALGEHDDL